MEEKGGKMKIYIVWRTDEIGYDEFDAHVVVASSPKRAKDLCKWADGRPRPHEIKAREIKAGKRARIILSSFNAG